MGGMPSMPEAPKEKSVYTYQDGDLVSSKEVNGDVITTKQVSSAQERANKEQRQKDLASVEDLMKNFLPTMNTIDPNLEAQLEAQAQTMSSSAQENLQAAFNDTIKSLQDTSSARFGSTTNSYYDKERDAITKTMAEQQAAIAQDIESRKGDLKQQELAGKQNYYNNLQGWAGNLRNDVNDFRDVQANNYNSNMQASQLSNNFDSSIYASKIEGYKAEVSAAAQKQASFMGMFSDERLKEGIVPEVGCLDKIKDLGVYNFNYIGSEDPEVGNMAQEIEKVYPHLISDVGGYKMVNYGGLIPILLGAINELNAKVAKGG